MRHSATWLEHGAAWVTLVALLVVPTVAESGTTVLDVDLSATVHDAIALELDGEPAIVVVGPGRSWRVAADGEIVKTTPQGAAGLALDTRGQLWACTEDGLRRVDVASLEQGEPVSSGACRAVEPLRPKDGVARLLTAGDDLRIVSIPDDAPATERILPAELSGWPVLAVDDRRFGAVSVGGQALLEEGPWGTTSFATDGAVGGLTVVASSWVWSLPQENTLIDVARRRIDVSEGPGALARADVNGDGRIDLLVAHPEHSVLGIVYAGTRTEIASVAPVGVQRVRGFGAWDADPCDEVLVVSTRGQVRVLDEACDPSVTENEPPESASPIRIVPVGEGVHPAVVVEVDQRVVLQLEDAGGDASAFAASGGPSGMVVSSSGSVLYRARSQDIGRWKVAVRLWEGGAWTRRAAFDLVVEAGDGPRESEALRVSRTTSDLAAALGEETGIIRRHLPLRGCMLGVGAALGGSQGQSWVTLGEGFLVSGSPAASFSCDGGTPINSAMWWSAGLDAAPFFVYLVEDTELRHGLSATLGVGYGRGNLRIGAFGSAGATILGMGPLVRWTPIETPGGRRHGFESRLMWIASRNLVVQGTLYYTMQIGDYRKGRGFR